MRQSFDASVLGTTAALLIPALIPSRRGIRPKVFAEQETQGVTSFTYGSGEKIPNPGVLVR